MVAKKIPNDNDLAHALEMKNFFAVPDVNSDDILTYVKDFHPAPISNFKI